MLLLFIFFGGAIALYSGFRAGRRDRSEKRSGTLVFQTYAIFVLISIGFAFYGLDLVMAALSGNTRYLTLPSAEQVALSAVLFGIVFAVGFVAGWLIRLINGTSGDSG